jgi:hypothetical protein
MSSHSRGKHGALANKRAADSRARALASTISELRAAGFISRCGLADELNRRGIPTARGGRRHYTTVVRMLSRLGGRAFLLQLFASADRQCGTPCKSEPDGFIPSTDMNHCNGLGKGPA